MCSIPRKEHPNYPNPIKKRMLKKKRDYNVVIRTQSEGQYKPTQTIIQIDRHELDLQQMMGKTDIATEDYGTVHALIIWPPIKGCRRCLEFRLDPEGRKLRRRRYPWLEIHTNSSNLVYIDSAIRIPDDRVEWGKDFLRVYY